MIVKVRIETLQPDAAIAMRLDGVQPDKITIPYDELFRTESSTRLFPALARRGLELVRVGDHVLVEQLHSGVWSRKAILRGAITELKVGDTVNGFVTDLSNDWVLLSIKPGIPARAPLHPLETYLQPLGMLREENRHLPLCGMLRVGDAVAGFITALEPHVDVDIAGHLRAIADGKLERRRLHNSRLREHAPEHEAPAYEPPPQVAVEPCPPGFHHVIVVEDDAEWVEGTLRPWLEAAHARVDALLTPEDWNHVGERAQQTHPDLILVDLNLAGEAGHLVGWDVIRGLVDANATWNILAMTGVHIDEEKPVRDCWGPVHKTGDMRHLVAGLSEILENDHPPAPAPAAVRERPVFRREKAQVWGHIEGLRATYATVLEAQELAVFAYHIPSDRALLKHGSPELSAQFDLQANSMQKSQIRDLAYAEDPFAEYPDVRRRGRSWRWIRSLVNARVIQGIRLETPDQDEVWSLFAFYDVHQAANRGRLEEAAMAIEDALWHQHHEFATHETRDLVELGQRVRELAHEVKRKAKAIQESLAEARNLLDTGSPDLSKIRAQVHELDAERKEIHELADRLLGRNELVLKEVRLERLLERCVYPYARPGSPHSRAPRVRVYAASVEPDGLTVKGDETLIRSIVDNLIHNGVQAIHKTEGLRDRCADGMIGEIAVEAYCDEADQNTVVIAVHDTGSGIPRYAERRMWERGYSMSGGTGLGMPICLYATEKLQGRLEVAYTAAFVGTAFTLRLQRYRA